MRLYFLHIEEFNEFTNCKFANLQIICTFVLKNLNKSEMKRNISTLDKNIRLLIIVITAILGYFNEFSITIASVLSGVSILLLVTILINFSPIYVLLGISTYKPKEKNS